MNIFKLAFALAMSTLLLPWSPSRADHISIGDQVPDFSVQMLDGKPVKLSNIQKDAAQTSTGIVVLSFWCTTCHSCRDIEHELVKLHKDYMGRVAVIALAANATETSESVRDFMNEMKVDVPVLLDHPGATADIFGVKRTTTTVVIDKDGLLRYCGQLHRKNADATKAALESVLAGKEVAVKSTRHKG